MSMRTLEAAGLCRQTVESEAGPASRSNIEENDMFIHTDKNIYHVAFELDRVRKSRASTCCKIFLLTTGTAPLLIGRGQTLQGKQDAFDSVTGCRFALTRALADTGLRKPARTKFWKEFHRRHCREAFANIGGTFSGLPRTLIDSGNAFRDELDTFPRQAVIAMSNPVGGSDYVKSFYTHLRVRHGTGKAAFIRKLYGLGWKRIIDGHTSEAIMPRSEAEKHEQYRKMYGMGDRRAKDFPFPEKLRDGFAERYRRMRRQAEGRNHRREPHNITIMNTAPHADVLKAMLDNKNKIKDILAEHKKKQQWLRGVWAVSDERLTARMHLMSLLAHEMVKKTDAELLQRPGITKVADEYIVDPTKFVPAFKAGEVVTWMGEKAKVFSCQGPLVKIHAGGRSYDVFDHELEPRPGWWGRVTKWWAETDIDRLTRTRIEEAVPGRGLWKHIDDNHCDNCHGRGDFLRGPRGGSCSNVKCKHCGQRYWVDPMTRTAKKI